MPLDAIMNSITTLSDVADRAFGNSLESAGTLLGKDSSAKFQPLFKKDGPAAAASPFVDEINGQKVRAGETLRL